MSGYLVSIINQTHEWKIELLILQDYLDFLPANHHILLAQIHRHLPRLERRKWWLNNYFGIRSCLLEVNEFWLLRSCTGTLTHD